MSWGDSNERWAEVPGSKPNTDRLSWQASFPQSLQKNATQLKRLIETVEKGGLRKNKHKRGWSRCDVLTYKCMNYKWICWHKSKPSSGMGTRKQSICVTPDTRSHVPTNFPGDAELEQRLKGGKLLIIKLAMHFFLSSAWKIKEISTNEILP
jgi:hypothetical protein